MKPEHKGVGRGENFLFHSFLVDSGAALNWAGQYERWPCSDAFNDTGHLVQSSFHGLPEPTAAARRSRRLGPPQGASRGTGVNVEFEVME